MENPLICNFRLAVLNLFTEHSSSFSSWSLQDIQIRRQPQRYNCQMELFCLSLTLPPDQLKNGSGGTYPHPIKDLDNNVRYINLRIFQKILHQGDEEYTR